MATPRFRDEITDGVWTFGYTLHLVITKSETKRNMYAAHKHYDLRTSYLPVIYRRLPGGDLIWGTFMSYSESPGSK